jgi:two-component system LytT family response regulator
VTRIRVLIADDEATARRRLARLAGALPDVEVVGECASGDEVLERLRTEHADVLLLDIQMPGLTGLDTSAVLPDDGPAVVFVTAHPEHALDAFGVGARDYLLKPVDAERLRRTLDRVRRQLSTDNRSGRVALSTRKGVRLLDVQRITHATYDGTAVIVHTDTERVFTDGTLIDLERRLDSEQFMRVHRRAIVNLDQVDLLESLDTGGYLARLENGVRVEVSRQAARTLRRRFGLGRGGR